MPVSRPFVDGNRVGFWLHSGYNGMVFIAWDSIRIISVYKRLRLTQDGEDEQGRPISKQAPHWILAFETGDSEDSGVVSDFFPTEEAARKMQVEIVMKWDSYR